MPKRRMNRHAVTQPLDKSYRLIPLTQNQNAIVDAEDFEWLNQWNWCAQWSPKTKSFYAVSVLPRYKKLITMNYFILNCKNKEESDHRNHNTLDNRRNNLRKVTRSQNMANGNIKSSNTSGYKGVSWGKRERKWRAYIKHEGFFIYLGIFNSANEAANAYDKAARKYYGEFAHLNFPSHTPLRRDYLS